MLSRKEQFQIAHGFAPKRLSQLPMDTLYKCLIVPKVMEDLGVHFRERDSKKSALYAAERELSCWSFDPTFKAWKETVAYGNKIIKSRWWKSRTPRLVEVSWRDGRGRRTPQSLTQSISGAAFNRIDLPKWSRSPIIILHELAHTLTVCEWQEARGKTIPMYDSLPASHGPEFAKNYLALVRRFIGKDAANELTASFKKHGVKYTARKPRTGKVVK